MAVTGQDQSVQGNPWNQQGQQQGMFPVSFSVPSFNMNYYTPRGGSSNNYSVELSGRDLTEAQRNTVLNQMGQNQVFGFCQDMIGQVSNIVGMGFQYGLNSQAMDCQYGIAMKYYDVQDKIAQYQQSVAFRQLAVYSDSIAAQQQMHQQQCLHEEEVARLESSTQARLASISEGGKTDRAKILALTDAFSRRGYSYGWTI